MFKIVRAVALASLARNKGKKDLEVLQDHSFTWNSWAVCHASFRMDCPPPPLPPQSSLRPNPLARLLDTSCSSLRRYHLRRGIRSGIIQNHNHSMSCTKNFLGWMKFDDFSTKITWSDKMRTQGWSGRNLGCGFPLLSLMHSYVPVLYRGHALTIFHGFLGTK